MIADLDELGLVDAPHEADGVMEVAEVRETLVAAAWVHRDVRTHQRYQREGPQPTWSQLGRQLQARFLNKSISRKPSRSPLPNELNHSTKGRTRSIPTFPFLLNYS